FAAAHAAGRVALPHRGAAREADAGGCVLVLEEGVELLPDRDVLGAAEFDAARRALRRARTDEGAAFRAQEQMAGRIALGGAMHQAVEGVRLARREAFDRREFVAARRTQQLVRGEALPDFLRLVRGPSGDRG